MAGWHHWLDGCESEWTLGVGDGQGVRLSDWTELNWKLSYIEIYKHTLLQIKHPCFTWDLGPLCPSFRRLQSPSRAIKTVTCGAQTGTWWTHLASGQSDCQDLRRSVRVGLWDKRLECPTTFLLYFIIYLRFKDFQFCIKGERLVSKQ